MKDRNWTGYTSIRSMLMMLMYWEENTETLPDASNKVGTKINIENSVYVHLSSTECWILYDIKLVIKTFENMTKWLWLETTITYQN